MNQETLKLANQLRELLDEILYPEQDPASIKSQALVAPGARALKWSPETGFEAIEAPTLMDADDLLHLDRQVGQIDRNTRLFLAGHPANHVLLWGARGTGKSSLIRAMLQRYGGEDLAMIELDRDALPHLSVLTRQLARQSRRYILFIDDLSFESSDTSYKSLKALLDGSLMAPPDNVLVYASSNRRHLLPETMQDNLSARVVEGELHEGDALDEKVSLSERFGLWLAFHPFSQEQYLDIVSARLESSLGTPLSVEIREQALRFARLRGSRSGRVAGQFVRYWQAAQLEDE